MAVSGKIDNFLESWAMGRKTTRCRCLLLAGLVTAGISCGPGTVRAEAPPERVQKAVRRALAYLAANQNRDGSWGGSDDTKSIGITALTGMAFLSAGHVPGRGPYGEHLDRTVRFILQRVTPSGPGKGFIAADRRSRMYGHGFATLFLAEVYGLTPREDIGRKLRLAVDLIVQTQKGDGGWRYSPDPNGSSDMSVTVCQVMALRAARNVGIQIPARTVDRAITYVTRSANPDGGFRYQLDRGSRASYALTAGGVTALCGAGQYRSPRVRRGAEYLVRLGVRRSGHYFYGHYYAAQAFYQVGGEFWTNYYEQIVRELLGKQRSSGEWQSATGNSYATAMAAMVLYMPAGYLPIFQK